MGGYIGARSGTISATVANVQDVTATDSTPEVTIVNNTHEDTDGGREGKVIFKGQQSGGEESTLAEIQASHDGTADDEKGDLIFRTNDGSDGASPTEAMRITSQQRVGIGDVDPIAPLHISSGDSGASASVHSDELFIEGSASSGITIGSATTGYGNLRFADSGGTDQGIVQYNHSDDMMRFVTDGSVRMTIDSGGHAAFTLGTNAMGTFSDGISEVGTGNFCLQVSNSASSALKPMGFRGEDIRFATGSAERMRVASNGYLGLGTSSPSYPLEVSLGQSDAAARFARGNTNTGMKNLILFRSSSAGANVGSIQITNSATSYVTSSDHRLKENVETLSNGITRVKELQPKRFSWIIDEENSANQDGFLAHEAQTVVPEAVTGTHNEVDDDGNPVHQGIDQAKLVPLLTAALQEAIAKIETLETKVAALEAE